MDRRTRSTYPKKATNKHHLLKPKQKVGLKVVYISNPMKFNTTASEFRTLVQKLTGRDADVPILPEPTTSNPNGDHRELMHPHAADHHAAELVEDDSTIKEKKAPTLSVQSSASEMGNGSDLSFDGDYLFGTHELLEKVPDFLSSNFWYDTR